MARVLGKQKILARGRQCKNSALFKDRRLFFAAKKIFNSIEYSVPWIAYAESVAGKRPHSLGEALALVGKSRKEAFCIFFRLALKNMASKAFAAKVARYFVGAEFDPNAKKRKKGVNA